MSLRLRIIAVFAVCIALPVAAGWTSLWLSTSQSTHAAAFASLEAQARATMRTLEERLARNLNHLKAWSTMPMMQEVLINDDGGELAQALADLVRAYPDFESLTITDTRGTIVATTDRSLAKAEAFEAGGTRAAISGRTTQETLAARQPAAIRFTVPLVASYDRRTVIGTLTGMIGLAAISGDMLKAGVADPAAPDFAIVAREQRQVVFATTQSATLAPAIRSLDTAARARPVPISVAGEPGIAAASGSGTRILGHDPGLFVITFRPSAEIAAPASTLSDIFLATSLLAAGVSIVIAWRWATPLVRLNEEASRTLKATRAATGRNATRQDSFTALCDAFARLGKAREERDTFAAHVQELALAIAIARDNAKSSNERLRQIAGTLTAHMAEVAHLVELINRENLAVAGRRHSQPRLEQLNRAALDLLQVIRDAVDAAQDEPAQTADVPASTRMAARRHSA